MPYLYHTCGLSVVGIQKAVCFTRPSGWNPRLTLEKIKVLCDLT